MPTPYQSLNFSNVIGMQSTQQAPTPAFMFQFYNNLSSNFEISINCTNAVTVRFAVGNKKSPVARKIGVDINGTNYTILNAGEQFFEEDLSLNFGDVLRIYWISGYFDYGLNEFTSFTGDCTGEIQVKSVGPTSLDKLLEIRYSGGSTNIRPNFSLGGKPSTLAVVEDSENIFSAANIEEAKNGITDYRCVYVYNRSLNTWFYDSRVNIIKPQTNLPPQLSLGLRRSNDLQKLTLTGTVLGGSIYLRYVNNDGKTFDTGEIYYPNLDGFTSNLQTEINAIPFLAGGVICTSTKYNNYQIVNILFSGDDGGKFHNLLQITDNFLVGTNASASITKTTDGSPINSITTKIGKATDKPSGVVFYPTATVLQVGTIKPNEWFPLWLRRTVPKGSLSSDTSGGQLEINSYAFPFYDLPPATPTPCEPKLVAQYTFNGNLRASQRNVPALVPINPEGQNIFETATVDGDEQLVYVFSGNGPTVEQGGFYLDATGLIEYDNYSIEIVFEFTSASLGAEGSRKIFDVTNRKTNFGVYVNSSNKLAIEPGGPGLTSINNNTFYKLTINYNGKTSTPTAVLLLNDNFETVAYNDYLDIENSNNNRHYLNFFLDDVVYTEQYGKGRIASLKIYNGSICPAIPTSPPTSTPIPTPTPLPTDMPTPTVTLTPIPTATPGATALPTPTPTISPIPTRTPGSTPVPTSTPMPTRLPGTLFVMGGNDSGQLGINSTASRSSPVQVGESAIWRSVSAGISFAAGIKVDGSLWTWGENLRGQLGNNQNGLTDKSSPVQIYGGGFDWKYVFCGNGSAVGIKNNGTLWSWGANLSGVIGDNSTRDRSSPVQTIAGGNNWIHATCSLTNAAGVKSDGSLWTWGENFSGQLGINKGLSYTNPDVILSVSSPVQIVATGNSWSTVHCGSSFMVATKKDGSLWTWGNNKFGQLGNSSYLHKSSPVQTVFGTNTWSSASAGQFHAAAIKSDGSLWLWGSNEFGQLGTNHTINLSTPTQTTAGGSNWSQVFCGTYNTIAVKQDGTVWTWGKNNSGSLGINSTNNRSSPTQVIGYSNNWVFGSIKWDIAAIL